MNYLDIILALPLIWGIWKGFSKGFILELCTLMALILGVYGALEFSDYTGNFLAREFNADTKLLPLIAFAVTFLIIVIVVHLFGRLLQGALKLVALGTVNKIAGAVFSLLKYALILSGLIYLINGFSVRDSIVPDDLANGSLLYEPIASLAPTIYPAMQQSSIWDKLKEQTQKHLSPEGLE